jgi:integrase/recombinase XerD
MNCRVFERPNRQRTKIYYTLEWGKDTGQRVATGVYTYTKPKTTIERNHNKEALAILQTKKSQTILELQASGTGYILHHKIMSNFFDYYEEFVQKNARKGNRSLLCSLSAFRLFAGKDSVAPQEITENLCERFRNYLLDNLSGETPADYFMRFKRMIRAATKDGYFRTNPAEDVAAKAKPSGKKDILSAAEYKLLMKAHCSNYEVKKAAIFSLYTGFRWCDVAPLQWKGRVFHLPTQDGANKVLTKWAKDAGIDKHITWHCLRHSISVLLQDNGTDAATVAGILGHTTTKYVHKTYQRYKIDSAVKAIATLPS